MQLITPLGHDIYIDLSTARTALRVSSFCLAAVGLQIEKYKILTSSKTVRFSQATWR